MPSMSLYSREALGMQERYEGAATLADALADTSSERGSVSAGCGGATYPHFRADVDGGLCVGCRRRGREKASNDPLCSTHRTRIR